MGTTYVKRKLVFCKGGTKLELVVIQNRQAVTSSLQIAESFEKEHRNVLQAIDELIGVAENSADLFYEDSYIHPQNKQRYRMFYMNRDGFTLLAMGLNGKKALKFKLKYIEAFNQMEQMLIEQPRSENAKLEIQRMRAEAMLNNSRTRQAKLILDMQKNKTLSPVAVELLQINALEILGDKAIEHRPEVEKSYTATELSEMFGVSAQKIGSLANKHNLKTDEYGYFALDKSKYSNKQVETFRYYESGKKKIQELLGVS